MIAWDLYYATIDDGGPYDLEDPPDYEGPPRCQAERLEPIEVPVDYELENGQVLECVVGVLDGSVDFVDAWDAEGNRVALTDTQREEIGLMAVRGY